ncbi:MAG: NAD(P)-binding domain-containing protein [Hyphomicrobiales bacterium]|nr:NAD(P)-binding domain-containing protein [Hyphomicrobiales bacterium]
MAQESTQTIGWVGIGRMGFPMAERLVKAGYDVRAWNRTRAKAEPLAKIGAALADNLSDLAEVDVLFSMVSTGKDLNDIYFGDGGDAGGAAGPFRRGFAQGRP